MSFEMFFLRTPVNIRDVTDGSSRDIGWLSFYSISSLFDPTRNKVVLVEYLVVGELGKVRSVFSTIQGYDVLGQPSPPLFDVGLHLRCVTVALARFHVIKKFTPEMPVEVDKRFRVVAYHGVEVQGLGVGEIGVRDRRGR